MGFSLHKNLAIIVLLTSVIYGCYAEWTITSSHPFALSGKEFNLTCETGSQATTFFIWYRNHRLVRHYIESCENQVTNQSLKYEFFCTSMTSFTVTIPAEVIDDEHGIVWQCLGYATLNPVVINVLHEPERNLTLTGYDGSILQLKQNLTLECISIGGRPWASLSWNCGGTPMQGSVSNSSDNVVSKLSLHLNETFSGQYCTCQATHPTWETPVEKHTFPLRVYYASTKAPTITGYKTLQGIREGENITLTCTVLDGYPLPSLTWIYGGTVMDSLNQSTVGVAKTVLPLSINRTFHEKQCFCNGISPANYSRTSNVSFIVLFSAVFVSSKVFKAVYGKRFDVKIPFYCQPAVKSINQLSWFKKDNNENLTEQNSDKTFTFLKTPIQIPFYRTNVTVDGQEAVMTMKVVSNTSEGSYVLRVQNMEDVNEIFEFKIEAKNPVQNRTLTGGKDQQTSLAIIVVSCVAVVVLIIVVIVIVYVLLKRRTSKGKDKKQRLSRDITGNRESYHYADITEFNEYKQIGGASNNPYSEPSNVTPRPLHEISTTGTEMLYDLPISPYAKTRIVEKSGSDVVNNDHIPIATVSPYAETHIVPKPCTGPVNNEFVQNENADTKNKPGPIYAEVNKQKKIVNTNRELGAVKDCSDSQKDDSNKVKKSEPVYSEVKKPKPIEKKDEALESKEQTKQVDEEGAAKHSYDSQKGDIKKPDPVNSEAKKPKPSEKKDEALDSKDQTEQDLIVAENNKFVDAVDQDCNRSDSRSDVVSNSTSLSTVNDTVVECEGETKNELNYVELDLSQQSDQKSEIISKEEKVEYAEVKSMA